MHKFFGNKGKGLTSYLNFLKIGLRVSSSGALSTSSSVMSSVISSSSICEFECTGSLDAVVLACDEDWLDSMNSDKISCI